MEIHELNTKSITDPAYIAADDGTDTYKMDLHNLLSTNLAAAKTYADSAVSAESTVLQGIIDADVADLSNRIDAITGIMFAESNTASDTQTKTLVQTISINPGQFLAIRLNKGNSQNRIKYNLGPNYGAVTSYYRGSIVAPDNIPSGTVLLYYLEMVETDLPDPTFNLLCIGYWASGGGGGTSDYTDLSNKPQINSVTLSGNKSLADIGAIALPSSASSGDFLTYNGSTWVATSLSTWQGGSY